MEMKKIEFCTQETHVLRMYLDLSPPQKDREAGGPAFLFNVPATFDLVRHVRMKCSNLCASVQVSSARPE